MPISQINTNSIAPSPGLTTPTIAQINSAASLTPTLFYDNAGVQVGTLCRAWVNYKGTSTVGINASFNVSSVTYNSTGNYTINFTNAMPDAKYAGICTQAAASNSYVLGGVTLTTTSYTVTNVYPGTGTVDTPNAMVAIFR